MNFYVVVYLSYGFHYRFRCYEKSKRSAIKNCILALGVDRSDIVDCYKED